ncbi:pectinesterase family protein [Actinoplanes couchii]|uniref:Ricin B lectin domain-containing protein n=1 Tax=Actinoplanes couchii TaxID=403638 RepID=A0ABQ3XE47_9ACTN|nr:pectinesterase family protein [Actinoplanes couchii]MDR6317279.1 pectinesterase [Actinoplanes couchii]GID56773.1 hypothetical protein Aco03nite_051770 [Actinoplanes couchii]
MRRLIPLVLAAAMITIPTSPARAAVAPAAGGTYTLVSGSSGKCLTVSSGNLLVQTACATGNTAQQFKVTAQGSGFTIGACVEAAAQLVQNACSGSAVQTWTFTASTAAAGKYLVKNAGTGLCMTNKDASTAGNNPIVQQACSDISQIQWAFNLVNGVPATATVAKDGTGMYTTVQAAINAVPSGNTTRRVITIKAGTYREQIKVPADKPNITLQGLGTSASQTVIVFNRNAGDWGATGSATAWILGKDFKATGLTFANDFDENSSDTGDQALAMFSDGDRAVYDNVRFLGDQDTLRVEDGNRAYFVNTYVEGTVDFIYSGGTAVFNACQIYEKRTSGGPITAASTPSGQTYGYLFYRSTITGAANNVTTLGRPWGQGAQVLYRESNLSATVKTAQPWTDMGDATWKNARFLEYRNTGAGATVNSNRPQLSDAQAPNYTPQKYLAGTDGWNPVG